MSLLDRGRELVTVYHEMNWEDSDGNPMTGPSDTGVQTRASIQPGPQSGTSARRAEQDNEGFETEATYRFRPPRGFPKIGAQARIEWNGEYWSLHGDAYKFNSSEKTAHYEYKIKRT